MIAQAARVIGDQVKCWHCPCTLGQIVDGLEEPRVFGAQPFYRQAAVPAAFAEAGIRSVLVIPSRIVERLRRTDLPLRNRRRQRLTHDGKVPGQPAVIVAMPVLMPCWRPGCGEPNRVDSDMTGG